MKKPVVIQIVGFKNSGKTTTTCNLIERFSALGWKVGSIKHDAHHFEIDHPGKDTWRHREAGAQVVAIASQNKTAIMKQEGTSLPDLLGQMEGMDIVLVEGYKYSKYPKIVILRNEMDISLLNETEGIFLISSWFPYQHEDIPVVSCRDYEAIFAKIQDYIKE
ncbi:molybdopterin-guanine dinucleotide biosynthesis protein B [Ammoniphilus resinae]|uniref:Molybdopterin-guanine dinucleotide biosynthesis protein B n=1 Tax=Ammoniphilus resinae TaxID=861532 RepID=A0ABS4GUH9_9BACL|nr:molybdopterin-guanine dinucleotide biosynthesis protein B [Ammoniphilus resinae]MBP1933934.1 molybdopterin-guanine dinucleotide biosynthesis protein B [Ammoniphilus resinae]